MTNSETIQMNRKLMEDILLESQRELRRHRRGKYFGWLSKSVLFIGLLSLAFFLGHHPMGIGDGDRSKPHVAFVEVYGPIMSGQMADADRLIPALEEAFKDPQSKAIALRINSPGGSPVQAGRMYNEINDLKKQYPAKRVFAVIEDLGASAAYYIASAADDIYVDQASMVGSIGVISEGFGFTDIMSKVGVERRVLTSGENKALLDPYLPVPKELEAYWKSMLSDIHQQFIGSVKRGRGDRLHLDTPGLFSGLVWTGAKSIEIGLTDKLGSLMSVSRDTIGEVNVVNYTPSPDFLKRIASSTHAQLASMKYELLTPTLF